MRDNQAAQASAAGQIPSAFNEVCDAFNVLEKAFQDLNNAIEPVLALPPPSPAEKPQDVEAEFSPRTPVLDRLNRHLRQIRRLREHIESVTVRVEL